MHKHLSILILVLLSTNLKASNQQNQILEQFLENSETKRQYPALTANEVTALLDAPITFGYIALQEGTTIFGRSIQIATASKWAHIALILCDPKNVSNNPSLSDQKNWYCFQAYAGHKSHIIPWKKYIVLEPGYTVVRPIMYDGNTADRPEFKEFIRKYIGKPYKSSSVELCLSACRSNTKHDPQSLFCSELVALTLQDSGLAKLDMLANNYVPADFSMQSSKPVKLIGANLGDEIQVFAFNKGFFGKTVDKFINMLLHVRTYFSSRP